VETLSDRLTHDPHLAGSLHEVLSTAAAIRSTASILAEPGELEATWRDKFHRNLNEDSQRLADSAKALVRYLDESENSDDPRGVPQEEAETFFSNHDHHFASIEAGKADLGDLVASASELTSDAARQIARTELEFYAADARAMPLDEVLTVLDMHGMSPIALAREFNVDLPTVFRRLAMLPDGALGGPVGLVVCDASGSILFRKPVAGFALPRHGESCPLWPLFAALSRPLVPIRRRVSQLGRTSAEFDCFAVAWPETMQEFEQDPVYRSVMLILPAQVDPETETPTAAQPVGTSCRVCPRKHCGARREPSVLSGGF
jgi:hypothetical protein